MAEEGVGSVGEEAARLLRALSAQPHVCTTGWCPVCRVVGVLKENPELVDEVVGSAAAFARSVRDVLERAVDREEPHA